MKTTLILSTVILLAVWTGCSDTLNITDPLNQETNVTSNQPNTHLELVWSQKELKVWTDAGTVEERASYVKLSPVPPQMTVAEYLITFKVSTTADKFTNGYVPLVNVSKDLETVFTASNFNGSDITTMQKEIRIKDSDFSRIDFYIALFVADVPDRNVNSSKIPGNSAHLSLNDINIYRTR